jgi:hypothetical protein
VLARLIQLRQLEALLQSLAATGTSAAQLPDLARPLLGAVVPGASGGAAAAAAAATAGKEASSSAAATPK